MTSFERVNILLIFTIKLVLIYVFFNLDFSVLRRLVTLISKQATLQASHAAAIKQAQGASDQAKKLLDENEKLSVSLFWVVAG